MRTNEQIELSKKLIREMEEPVFQIWLKQFDNNNYYTKEEGDRYDRE